MPADQQPLRGIGWTAAAAVSQKRRARWWALIALGCYLVVVFILAFVLKLGQMPLPERVGSVLSYFQDRNLLAGIRYGHVEAAANVLFFVPLGALVPITFGPPRWLRGWVLCIGLSVSIETIQWVFLSGRVASVRDALCNAIGAGIGVLLTLTVLRSRVSAHQKSPVQGQGQRID